MPPNPVDVVNHCLYGRYDDFRFTFPFLRSTTDPVIMPCGKTTFLSSAIIGGNLAIVQMILNDVDLENRFRDELNQPKIDINDFKGNVPLLFSPIFDNIHPLVELLIKHGADVNAIDSLNYAPMLVVACYRSLNYNIIKTLLENGADIKLCDVHGNDAMYYAYENKDNLQVIELMEHYYGKKRC
jgi:ankyrin repeat protein